MSVKPKYDIQSMIEKIVFVPSHVEKNGVSYFQQLQTTGYFEHSDDVTVSRIERALHQFPEVIALWHHLSNIQRSQTPFIEKVNGKYLVGHRMGKFPTVEYSDITEATANYIFKTIESIRAQ